MNKLKGYLIKFLLFLNHSKWRNTNKIKILIQTNPYFTEVIWLNSLKSKLKNYSNCEFIFPKNKISLIKLIKNADACFLWSLSSFIDLQQTNLKIIYFGSVGLESLENRKIPEQIKIFYPKGISAEAIAEYVLTMAVLLNRDLHLPIMVKTKRKWVQKELLQYPYTPLRCKKIGVIGYGTNGKAVAKLLKGIGCHVNALDINRVNDPYVDSFYLVQECEEFIKSSDIIILTPSLNKTTNYMVNENFLNKLKEDSILINVSRGKIINDNSLKKIINTNKIKYVALDVFEKEPLPFYDWKWRNKKVIITPHISGNINYFVNDVISDFISLLNKEI